MAIEKPRGGAGMNDLTQLADKYGSDKGSKKHRYTELYHMLFSPFRDRKINFMEMGLLIGGPEHEISKDRETKDLPSIRMWLEYFKKAHVTGLDVSDFSWFENERFNFIRCDMDERANIQNAAAQIDNYDIILDDASHASTHQQNAFLELFPKVKSGGLYVIEDLRWQPPVYEEKFPNFTKTSDLFQSFLDKGHFVHTDQNFAKEFDAMRDQMSGVFVFQVHFNRKKRDQVAVIHKI